MNKLFRTWRFILPFLFLFVLLHFLKDVTQDILGIKTPLDMLGDVKEDLSWLPDNLKNMYLYGLGGLSLLTESFLLVSIPLVLKRKASSRLETYSVIAAIFLFFFFLIAILLDPKYKFRV